MLLEKQSLITFMSYHTQEEMVDNLREFLRIDEDSLPLLLILDIPEQRMVRCHEKEITRDIIRDFIEKYLANQLKYETLEGL